MYIVRSGEVETYVNNDQGERIVLETSQLGDLFGETSSRFATTCDPAKLPQKFVSLWLNPCTLAQFWLNSVRLESTT